MVILEKTRKNLCVIVSVVLLIAIQFPLYLDRWIFVDEGLIYTVGKVVASGGIPYVDIFEIKPPGVFYMSAAVQSVTSEPVIWGRTLLFVGYGVVSVLVYRTASIIYENRLVAQLSVIAFLASLALPNNGSHWFLEEPFLMACFIIFAYLYIQERWFLAGAAFAMGLLFKQTALLVTLAIAIVAVIRIYDGGRSSFFDIFSDMKGLALGTVAVLVPVTLFMAWIGALGEMITVVFGTASGHPTVVPGMSLFSQSVLRNRLSTAGPQLFFLFIGGAYMVIQFLSGSRRPEPRFLIVFTFLLGLNFILQGGNTFLYLSMPLAILTAAGLCELRAVVDVSPNCHRTVAIVVVALVLSISLIGSAYVYSENSKVDNEFKTGQQNIQDYFHSNIDSDTLCAEPYMAEYFVILDKRPVTRWIPEQNERTAQMTINDLNSHQPEHCLVRNKESYPFPSIITYIEDKYVVEKHFNSGNEYTDIYLYVRKNSSATGTVNQSLT